MSLLLTIAAVYAVISVACSVLWCVSIALFGARDCNPPALRAARRAEMQARHDFVATHMSRYPVHS
jgi:hypothetical protein